MIEIHGALRLELDSRADYFYQQLCSGKLGVRWVAYAPDHFRPRNRTNADQRKWQKSPFFTEASVPPLKFATVVKRVLRGEHDALLDEYAAKLHTYSAPRVRQSDVPY